MKKNKSLNLGIYLISFVGLLIFAFYDLEISIFLYNNKQIFSTVLEVIGELPLVILGGVSSLIIFKTAKFEKRYMLILNHIFAAGLFLINILVGIYFFHDYIGMGFLGFIIIALGITALDIVIFNLLKFHNRKKIRQIGLFGAGLFILVVGSVNVLKIIWGRERFRHMAGDYSGFSPWYLIQGLTTKGDFMSFPSGHAANASVIIWLMQFPKIEDKKFFKYFSFLWIIAVMYSRVVMGAHFASDVTVGMLLALSSYLLLEKFFESKFGNKITSLII